jgi:hypothetical protein
VRGRGGEKESAGPGQFRAKTARGTGGGTQDMAIGTLDFFLSTVSNASDHGRRKSGSHLYICVFIKF